MYTNITHWETAHCQLFEAEYGPFLVAFPFYFTLMGAPALLRDRWDRGHAKQKQCLLLFVLQFFHNFLDPLLLWQNAESWRRSLFWLAHPPPSLVGEPVSASLNLLSENSMNVLKWMEKKEKRKENWWRRSSTWESTQRHSVWKGKKGRCFTDRWHYFIP